MRRSDRNTTEPAAMRVDRVLKIPASALVMLIGPSGAGKSSFARAHFKPTEIVSSDVCRGLVSDDENDQSATDGAFAVLHAVVEQRLRRLRLTVVDATHVHPEDRRPLLAMARQQHALVVAIVIDPGEEVCLERNAQRPDRQFGPQVVRRQRLALRKSMSGLAREGIKALHVFCDPAELANLRIERQPLYNDRRELTGPFDLIGDVHGCAAELDLLLARLGYQLSGDGETATAVHPDGRTAVFVGDLVDRGPDSPAVLARVMNMVEPGAALCVAGNHEVKLERALAGAKVKPSHGLQQSLDQLAACPPAFVQRVRRFFDGLISHYLLDGGKLVVAHAGLKEDFQGRASAAVRSFCLYGETTGETDDYGLPVRYPWASDYRGKAMVVYGHTPVVRAEWLNNTICLDTGCVFGGELTALRYPERELVSVPAAREYYEPIRPLAPALASASSAQQDNDRLLDLGDVSGKKLLRTQLRPGVIVRADQAAAALEVMSRFTLDPRWLVYLPPTMAPPPAAPDGPWLEHPQQAFAEYQRQGVSDVLLQEKHMGSRAVAIVGRSAVHLSARFGIETDLPGVLYTRSGRRFFKDAELERGCVEALQQAALASGLFERLQTDWLVLDGELLPWSAKAGDLLRLQYAAVGAAAGSSFAALDAQFANWQNPGLDPAELRALLGARAQSVHAYVQAYRRYCWPVESSTDLRFAPFAVLAGEGHCHALRDHVWQLEQVDALAQAAPQFIQSTGRFRADLSDPQSVQAATDWWLALTAAGGEGMVVKPTAGVVRGDHGLVQPGIKCRGREYLRIIYGPEYDRPDQLERLRGRKLMSKRRLALDEYALGIEALERFVRREPLRRVHECVFAVLALETEVVDPRL